MGTSFLCCLRVDIERKKCNLFTLSTTTKHASFLQSTVCGRMNIVYCVMINGYWVSVLTLEQKIEILMLFIGAFSTHFSCFFFSCCRSKLRFLFGWILVYFLLISENFFLFMLKVYKIDNNRLMSSIVGENFNIATKSTFIIILRSIRNDVRENIKYAAVFVSGAMT